MTQDPYRNPTPPRDGPYSPPPAPAAEDLQFDRVESAAPPSPASVAGFQPAAPNAATACAACGRPIADYYFEAGGKVLCPECQQMIAAATTGGSAAGRVLKAIAFGFVAAVAGAAAWWAASTFVFKHTVYAIGGLVVAFLIGGAVKRGSANRGGIGYQLLAVLFTYLAIGATITAAELSDPASKSGQSLSPVALAIVSAFVALVAPVLAAVENPIMGLLFVFAFWEAWKINKHRPLVINGPYRVGGPAGAPQAMPTVYGAPGAFAPPAAPGAYPPPAAPGAWPPPPPTGAA